MRNKFFRLSLLSVFLFSTVFVQAQNFDSLLKKLDAEYPQEKLYLHFDKSVYSPGETIWFKAYLFSGNTLSLISKTLYTDLLDEHGKVLQHLAIPVLESTAASSFDLPASATGSSVFVRAYTKWMLNFDSSFLYEKTIPIVNAKKSTQKTIASGPSFYLQFFPEGGDLVEGLNSRVAFKATDKRGLPINVSGDVVDGAGKKVTSFTSVHDGMGYFIIIPAPNETYKAVWKDENGVTHQNTLPSIKKDGFVLEVNNKGAQLNFSIRYSGNIPASYPSVYIVAQTQQEMIYKARANLTKAPVINGSIPLQNIPAGIVQVTLFNEQQQPLAERIVFANQQDYYFITDVNASLKDLNKRKKNSIQIDVPDTLLCNLSVSVTDADINTVLPNEDNIFSHLLLTSDIKGYVHHPGYYFQSDADSIIKNLDLVMMTNGWRRFKWEDVANNKWPKIKYAPENFLAIEGSILGLTQTEMANKELTAILELKNGNKNFMYSPIKPGGKFSYPNMIFYDTAKIYYQLSNDKTKSLTTKGNFTFTNNFLTENLYPKPDTAWRLTVTKQDSVEINKSKDVVKKYLDAYADQKVKVLSAVVIKAKQKTKEEKLDEEYASGMFKSSDYTFDTQDDPFANSSLTVLDYLRGKVAGLTISGGGSQTTLSWRGGTPSLYMNEVQSDVDMITSIPLSDVALIKVYRPPFMGGFGGSGGAIAVYLKNGATGNRDVKGLNTATIVGYSPVKEFYSPDYAKPDENIQNDLRTTLYWNPFVLTEKDKRRIQLPFYNNDVTKRIRVVVEGINEDGKLTRIEKVFE